MTTLPVGATEVEPGPLTLQAGEDLSTFQFHGVVLRTDGQLDAYDTITEVPFGVLQNKPDAAGKAALVVYIGVTKLALGGTVASGAQYSFNSSGKAITFVKDTNSTTFSAGIMILGGDSGEEGFGTIGTANPPSGEE